MTHGRPLSGGGMVNIPLLMKGLGTLCCVRSIVRVQFVLLKSGALRLARSEFKKTDKNTEILRHSGRLGSSDEFRKF